MKESRGWKRKKRKIKNNDKGRIYQILDYIFKEYDKDFRKTFQFAEFEDFMALNEILQEIKETNKKFIKISYVKKQFKISNSAIRYLRNIYVESNGYDMSLKCNLVSISLALLAIMASMLLSYITDYVENYVVSIILYFQR